MKTILEVVNITDQTLDAGDKVDFGINQVLVGDGAIHLDGSSSVMLARKGKYLVMYDADFTIGTTGPVTFQLLFKDALVNGASDTIQATATEPSGIHIHKIIEIKPSCCCIDNRGPFQVQVTAAGVVNNSNLIVVEL